MPPREDYLLNGAHDLGDSDLLALVLGTGVRGQSARTIAFSMLEEFGSTLALAQAPPAALARVRGVGDARAVRLHAALQLGLRTGRGGLPPSGPVTRPDAAAALLVPRFRGLAVEEVHALYLDRRAVHVYPRVAPGNAGIGQDDVAVVCTADGDAADWQHEPSFRGTRLTDD